MKKIMLVTLMMLGMVSANADYVTWNTQLITDTKTEQCKLCAMYEKKVKECAKNEMKHEYRKYTMVYYIKQYNLHCTCKNETKEEVKRTYIDLSSI